jgi:hypothetical protein
MIGEGNERQYTLGISPDILGCGQCHGSNEPDGNQNPEYDQEGNQVSQDAVKSLSAQHAAMDRLHLFGSLNGC